MKSKITVALLSFISLTRLVSAQSNNFYGCFGPWGMMGYGYGGSFMWFFGFTFWILIVIALALLIFWLIKQIQTPKNKK